MAETALKLMRSRYSAFALKLPDYIISTTHPDNPQYSKDTASWRSSILMFCNEVHFDDLKIIEFIDGKDEAFVTFFAQLRQGEADASFQEKSRFLKIDGRWFYHSGQTSFQ